MKKLAVVLLALAAIGASCERAAAEPFEAYFTVPDRVMASTECDGPTKPMVGDTVRVDIVWWRVGSSDTSGIVRHYYKGSDQHIVFVSNPVPGEWIALMRPRIENENGVFINPCEPARFAKTIKPPSDRTPPAAIVLRSP